MAAFSRQTRRELIGLGLTLLLLTIAGVVFFIEEIKHALRDTYNIVAVFPEAPRLRHGSTLWVAGHPVGRVDRVELLTPSNDTTRRVAVVLEVAQSARELIRRDSRLHLTSARLIGDPVVEIDPGSVRTPPLREGDTIRYHDQPTSAAIVFQRLTQTRAALDTLMTQSHVVLEKIDRKQAQMSRVQRQAREAAAELAVLQKSLNDREGTLGLMMDTTRPAFSERLSTDMERISEAMTTAQKRFSIVTAAPQRERLMRNLGTLRRSLDSLQAMVNSPSGYYGRSQRDSALTRAMNGARAQVDSLMTDARKHPMRYVF